MKSAGNGSHLIENAEEEKQGHPEEDEEVDNIYDAVKGVVRESLRIDGLVNGLNQVCKALDRKEALMCVLAEDCADAKYKKLVSALCKTNSIPLVTLDKRDDLGEWLGQCRYDKAGVARKVKGASSLAILDYGYESKALRFLI
jgi:small subunit ribosomal protein S12e